MKAEKVLGILACAVVCASGSAFANTTNEWFSVTPDGSDIGLSQSAETNGVAVVVAESKITIDNDFESAFAVGPNSSAANPALNDGLVTITSQAVLTPCEASDLEVVAGAQAGFAVAVDGSDTNFYGYASAGGDGNAPAWIKLANGTLDNPEALITFTIALDYRDRKVSFYQGDTLLVDGTSASKFNISNDFTKLNNIAAYGSGSISSIASKYEVAVAAAVTDSGATTNLYGSAVEAVIAAGQSGSVKEIDPSGEAVEAKTAENGLATWECEVLGIADDDANAKIPLAPADEAVAGVITIKFDGSVASGVEAKFKVQKLGSEVGNTEYPAAAIQIPMETGTYKVVPVIKAAQQ